MLERVSQRTAAHNNLSFIANSRFLSTFKLLYYRLFAYLYGVMGKRSKVIMVNSSWTFGHIKQLWKAPARTHIVYPPCDVSEFMKIPLTHEVPVLEKNIISVGQFRPEKDHPLMIRSFKSFLSAVWRIKTGKAHLKSDSASVMTFKRNLKTHLFSQF
nr:hypothetical protein BaRGS_018020 [Batillaria attramentaria]